MLVTLDERDSVSRRHLALLQDCEVKAGKATREETFDDVITAELDAQLVAWHSRLRHHHLGRTHPEAVTNMDRVIQQPLNGDIFPEHCPGKLHVGKLLPPEMVVLGWIGVDCFIRAAVNGQIGLAVTVKVEPPYSDPSLNRLLEYSGRNRFPPPDHLAGEPDIDRDDAHRVLWLHLLPHLY